MIDTEILSSGNTGICDCYYEKVNNMTILVIRKWRIGTSHAPETAKFKEFRFTPEMQAKLALLLAKNKDVWAGEKLEGPK